MIAEPKGRARARKIYLEHERDCSIRVPMREIELTNGERHRVYDTSGPYTDPDVATDVRHGIAPMRDAWIEGRADTVRLERATSIYRRAREAMP
jgi:phosphomethylpyrimidine synthase